MFCGTASFKNIHDDSLPSSPKKKKANRNPYSLRGLDKYSELMAELETRRAKVMEHIGSQGVSVVRFRYSGSNDWIPIIINLKDVEQNEGKKKVTTNNKMEPVYPAEEIVSSPRVVHRKVLQTTKSAVLERPSLKKSFSWGAKESCKLGVSWPVVVVMILLCLVVFGKVFAICCVSVLWYLVPIFRGDDEFGARKSFKKNYVRKLSLQELSSPKGRVSMKRGRGN